MDRTGELRGVLEGVGEAEAEPAAVRADEAGSTLDGAAVEVGGGGDPEPPREREVGRGLGLGVVEGPGVAQLAAEEAGRAGAGRRA